MGVVLMPGGLLIGQFIGIKLKCRISWSRYCCVLSLFLFFIACCSAQITPVSRNSETNSQLNVNWLYGAYVPKEVPLKSLTNHQRFQLYLRQSFTTPGIYAKSALFSIGDQISDTPPEWQGGVGFFQRFGSRQGQFVVQNSISALGNALLGYEPRYDRCQCSGWWGRTTHALLRNFVTYNESEKTMRPQIALYAGAFGAGVVASTWKPGNRDLVVEGYHSAITQVGFGMPANLIGEFAPEVKRMLRGKKHTSAGDQN